MDNRDEAKPEIRPASIRGQLRMWYRLTCPNPNMAPLQEKEIFGGVHGGAKASPIVVRVANLQAGEDKSYPTLPHKSGGMAAPKHGFPAGTSFVLQILERRGGIGNHQQGLQNAIEAWLLLGGLGLRVTRAAGSLQWDQQPADPTAFQQKIQQLTQGTSIRAALLGEVDSADNLRRIASDTIGGHKAHDEKNALNAMGYPLGGINLQVGGNRIQRKTSPLRFSIKKFADGHRLVAVWDKSVYGPFSVGPRLVKALKDKGKKIGNLLEPALPILTS